MQENKVGVFFLNAVYNDATTLHMCSSVQSHRLWLCFSGYPAIDEICAKNKMMMMMMGYCWSGTTQQRSCELWNTASHCGLSTQPMIYIYLLLRHKVAKHNQSIKTQ